MAATGGGRLYVGNLPYSVSETELRELFEVVAPVKAVVIPIDRATNRSKGFGFVEFEEAKDAVRAIDAYHATDFKGRTLKVNEARPRD